MKKKLHLCNLSALNNLPVDQWVDGSAPAAFIWPPQVVWCVESLCPGLPDLSTPSRCRLASAGPGWCPAVVDCHRCGRRLGVYGVCTFSRRACALVFVLSSWRSCNTTPCATSAISAIIWMLCISHSAALCHRACLLVRSAVSQCSVLRDAVVFLRYTFPHTRSLNIARDTETPQQHYLQRAAPHCNVDTWFGSTFI